MKSKSFLADAENSPMLDHSHTSKEKSNFLALCWTVEMLHILKMLEAITTVIPSGKRQVSAAAGALTSQHQQKGEGEGREVREEKE